MSNLNKLTFDGECFMWGENQVGFLNGDNSVCVSLSEEDFENGELDEEERNELRLLRKDIEDAICSMGYEIENPEEY